jgi:hypothetical protein
VSIFSWRAWVAGFILCVVGGVARADDGVDPRFLSFLHSDAHQAAVLKAATDQAQGLPTPCATAHYRPAGDLALFLPPQFDGGGRIIHGLWREQVLVDGCGTVELLNIFSFATASGEPKLLGGLPGTTRADLALQRQALPLAVRGLPDKASLCHDTRVVDTVLAPDAPTERTAPWRESWTVLACDEAYPVPLRFTPTADGATITIDAPPHP